MMKKKEDNNATTDDNDDDDEKEEEEEETETELKERSLVIDISGLSTSKDTTINSNSPSILTSSSSSSECTIRASPGIVSDVCGNPPLSLPDSASVDTIPSADTFSSVEPENIFFMHQKPLTKVQRVLVIMSVWFSVIVCFAVLFSIFFILWQLIAKRSILSIAFLSLFMFLTFVPKNVQIWPEYASNRIFQFWASYFDFSMVSEAKLLRPSHKYIFASFPHGIFPAGVFFSQV